MTKKQKNTPKQDEKQKAIRNWYSEIGVKSYYQQHALAYANPHFSYIEHLLAKNTARIDYSNVLDFCCGGGEVTLALSSLGFNDTQACDPFTYKTFEQNIGKPCLRYDFEDVIKGKLANEQYSSIICSFAMHLCPEKQLYPLVANLLAITSLLVIITPHKKPDLSALSIVSLVFDDFVLTEERGKKVRLAAYTTKSLS